MEYQLLETFIVISEVRNLTKASRLLYKTQPTISNRIQQLEDKLGYSLIVREKGKQEVELTKRGRIFLEKAKRLYELYGELCADTENIAEMLMISSIASYQIPIVCRVCKKMLEKSDIRFLIFTYQTEDVYERISNKSLDLALVSAAQSVQGVNCELVFTQQYYVVMPGMPSKIIEPICIEELDPDREIYQPWDDEFFYWHEQVFQGRKPKLFVDSYATLKELFACGQYWTILQESNLCALRKDMPVRIFRLNTPPPTRKGYLLSNCFADTKVRPLIQLFREMLIETAEEFRIEAIQ